jgi:enoyl-[acyl-carrier protein] reductase III
VSDTPPSAANPGPAPTPSPGANLFGDQAWALILGASSGFGEAAALALAEAGMHVIGVHLDRRSTLPNVERITTAIRARNREALFFNVNAADTEKRKTVLDEVQARLVKDGGQVRVFLHSLAFGTLRPFMPAPGETAAPNALIDDKSMDMTLNVMAHSLVYWVQDLVARKLIGRHGRVFSMTSSGGTRVWPTYGAVSAAKASLESHTRQLALELAPLGISVNAIRAGVTDTPALRKIPGNDQMMALALKRNPSGRLTTPNDVAQAIVALAHPYLDWLTGNTLGVDGGEDIIG